MFVTAVAPQTSSSPAHPVQAAVAPAAAETARPVVAVEPLSEGRLSRPVRAEAGALVLAREEEGAEAEVPGKGGIEAQVPEEPDPMVPPVPIRYLAELMRPETDASPGSALDILR